MCGAGRPDRACLLQADQAYVRSSVVSRSSLAVLLAVVALCLLACGPRQVSAGISESQAIETARHQAQAQSSSKVELLGVKSGSFRDFRGGATDAVAPGNKKVWAVSFSGTFQGSGGPACISRPCATPAFDHTITLILDYGTGAFIMASIEP